MNHKKRPKRKKPLVTLSLSAPTKAVLKLEAEALGISQGELLERAYKLFRKEVAKMTAEERAALQRKADENFANIIQKRQRENMGA